MRRKSPIERALPLAHVALAVAMMALLFPTVLRPPQAPPPTSAELSPDAPPQDDPGVVLTELGQGTTRTTGLGGSGVAEEPEEVQTRVVRRPKSCRYGYGEPVRQTESLYAPECAPAFVGSNPGETYKGVTATEVRMGVSMSSANIGQHASYDGPVPEERQPNESAQDRTYRVWQAYFNEAFNFYGRKLRWYHANGSSGSAAAVKIDEEWSPFGIATTAATDETLRRKLLHFGSYQRPEEFYQSNFPYAWAWAMDGSKVVRFVAELQCKQMAGKPPEFNERMDPIFDYDAPRKFGAIFATGSTLSQEYLDALATGCNETSTIEYVDLSTGADGNASNNATVVSKLRADGVTTIACFCLYLLVLAYTNVATEQNYWPEWVNTAFTEQDTNTVAGLMNERQWAHAVGIHPGEVERPITERDFYRAYQTIDPDGTPNTTMGQYVWPHMFQVATSLQVAGPDLRPESWAAGLIAYGRREPEPYWSIGGGYAPGDYTFADYVSIGWYDPDMGAYRHMFDPDNPGKLKFLEGEIPKARFPWFEEGIDTPPQGEGRGV